MLPSAHYHRDNASGKSALVYVECADGERRPVWLPHSQIRIGDDGTVRATSWIVSQRSAEIGVDLVTEPD